MTDVPQQEKNITVPPSGKIEAFAIIVDLNGFTQMVAEAERMGDAIAQFVHDCLYGIIKAIEAEGGEIVGFMGDAVLAIIQNSDNVVTACYGMAHNIDQQCEYVSGCQENGKRTWPYCPGGPSIKIAIEYGVLDVTTISSRFVGTHRLLIGSPINYAARIITAPMKGNRCIIGPAAAQMAFNTYGLNGPFTVSGKTGEGEYCYYHFSMGDAWIEGDREKGRETFWG